MRRKVQRIVRAFEVLIAGTAMLSLAGFGFLAWQIDRLGQHDDARTADAIVVLGARVEPNGQPGSDLSSRTQHAISLWKAGYAPELICSGGFKNERLSAAAVCRDYAVREGVPEGNIWLADGTANTAQDARAASDVMAEHGWHSAILVSHPLHLFRARWFFEQAGVQVVTSPTTTETGRIYLPLRCWYAVREAGSMIVTTVDGWGWLPATWKAQLESWRLNLP
jgi:uncharacterized SAM-binding protein YcdF (DUF218 family)